MLVAPFAGSQAVAQTHNLTGTVVDAQGNPVAGAAVVIDGTTKGTSTGSDGSFALNGVMANQSLLVTFIGYEPQTVAIGSQTNMKVVLKEDNQTLDEVVVIGYGVQKKRDVTGSITSVKSDVFESRSVENAQQALQGKAPGVQVLSSSAAPGSSPSIRIRGFSSNNSGASEPLYVVDGLKVSDISYLDPSSIESMEILKDGASAAIYGVEAGNGVVLITTKKGKKGDGRIFYDFTYGITSLARKADLMNAEQYVAYQTAAGNSQSLSAWDGKTDTDWFDVLYGDNGSFQRHTAGVEMANDYGSVYASLSYMDNDGMYYGNKDWLKRVTFQLNGDYKVKKWAHLHDQQYGRKFAFAEQRRRREQSGQQQPVHQPLRHGSAAARFLGQGQPAGIHDRADRTAGRQHVHEEREGRLRRHSVRRQGRGQPAYPLLQQHGRA